ncbi:citryl-CoA lyase [Acrocarpospora pleiomorpha]|uniref:Citryl-CoA lyase n=1 Tax=Acrocarpospora pleiomorpha TaxID=90975 RepID=A0A5M3XJ57_9ACTN|nr:CoA ester lyase [Acrocarpospora pleiomorpha]GES20706.1 citryl-CoA lyase [Acrocarpospora pleiomorpha]
MTADTAVTWLFVPGNRPERFDKAARSGADRVIVDLEDAVTPAAKESARQSVVRWLSGGRTAWVRINGSATPWHDHDLACLSDLPGLAGLVVPKAEDPADLDRIRQVVGGSTALVALIETARGVRDAHRIAEFTPVARLAFGAIDFALDIDAAETDQALLLARSTLVVASRAAGKPAPLDGVTQELGDPRAAAGDAARARALGFGGKLCIHPAQIAAVRSAFEPSAEEVEWARRVLEHAEGPGAGVTPDGQFVDKPVVERARRIVGRMDTEGRGHASAT